MAGNTDYNAVDRSAPNWIDADVACGIAAHLGGRVVAAAILEIHILRLVDVILRIDMGNFGHGSRGDAGCVAGCANAVDNGFGMAVIAGQVGLIMPWMRIGVGFPLALVLEHRHGSHPFTAGRPDGQDRPVLPVAVSSAVMAANVVAGAARMAMT